jgi:hypothetical protein
MPTAAAVAIITWKDDYIETNFVDEVGSKKKEWKSHHQTSSFRRGNPISWVVTLSTYLSTVGGLLHPVLRCRGLLSKFTEHSFSSIIIIIDVINLLKSLQSRIKRQQNNFHRHVIFSFLRSNLNVFFSVILRSMLLCLLLMTKQPPPLPRICDNRPRTTKQ